MAALIGGECGEECMHMAESLSRSPETITALLIRYTPIQYEKFTIKQNIYIYIYGLYECSRNFVMLKHKCPLMIDTLNSTTRLIDT